MNPIVLCIIAALAYPAGALVGYVIDRAIKAIWPPKPMAGATRRFHIRKA